MRSLLACVFLAGCGSPQPPPPTPTVNVESAKPDAASPPAELTGTDAKEKPPVDLSGDVGDVVAGAAAPPAASAKKVEAPKGDARPSPSSSTVPIPDADRVVAGLRPRFRACYQHGLNTDPKMQGSVVILAMVDVTGEVTSAKPTSLKGLSVEVTNCLAAVVKRATFSQPTKPARLDIPVTFVQK